MQKGRYCLLGACCGDDLTSPVYLYRFNCSMTSVRVGVLILPLRTLTVPGMGLNCTGLQPKREIYWVHATVDAAHDTQLLILSKAYGEVKCQHNVCLASG